MGLEKEESRMTIANNSMRVGTIIKPILQMRKQAQQGEISCPKLHR